MKRTLFVLLALSMITIFAVGTVHAFKLPGGLPGASNLKKEVKSFKLSDLDADLKEFEGTDFDPAKAAPVACNVFGDADYDKVAVGLAKTNLFIGFANNVLKDANAKIDAATKAEDLDAAKKGLEAAAAAGGKMVPEISAMVPAATSLITNLPGKAKSDPLGYGANLADMTKVAKDLPTAAKQLPTTVDELKKAIEKLIAKKNTFVPAK
ncbi:MAG: hypothetical protein GX444_06270 [Myxococcales bacterium]|nr:hypothetical protein [Myxococcales bacterium]